jgi:hypothetical protein
MPRIKRRYRLRRGARSGQEDMLMRLERIQGRLKKANAHSFDALTVERAIELVQADLIAIEKWLQVDFEDITRIDYRHETEDVEEETETDQRIAALEARVKALEEGRIVSINRERKVE